MRLARQPLAGPSGRHRVVSIGTIAAGTIVVAGVAAQLVDYGVYDLSVRALDSNAEGSVVERVADAALLAASVGAWLLARQRARPAAEIALAGALTFLALDRLLGLHDHVAHWRLLYLPILAGTALGLLGVARRNDRVAVTLLVAGLLLLGCSLLLHELGDWLAARLGAAPNTWLFQLKVGLKHATEAAGWVLVALALLGPRRCRPAARIGAARRGPPRRGATARLSRRRHAA
jgi:hypothetical protein